MNKQDQRADWSQAVSSSRLKLIFTFTGNGIH